MIVLQQVFTTDPAQRAFFDRMDEAVAIPIECKRHFKREPEPIINRTTFSDSRSQCQ